MPEPGGGRFCVRGLLAASILAQAITGIMVSDVFNAEVQSILPFMAPPEAIPAVAIGWGTVAASISLILGSWYMLAVPGEIGGQLLVRVLSGLRVAGTLMGLWVVVVVWGVVGPELSWPMMFRQ